jgi:hypothetical protein
MYRNSKEQVTLCQDRRLNSVCGSIQMGIQRVYRAGARLNQLLVNLVSHCPHRWLSNRTAAHKPIHVFQNWFLTPRDRAPTPGPHPSSSGGGSRSVCIEGWIASLNVSPCKGLGRTLYFLKYQGSCQGMKISITLKMEFSDLNSRRANGGYIQSHLSNQTVLPRTVVGKPDAVGTGPADRMRHALVC